MNRNYRVVFNQSTGTYVAVAENTTARKKSNTTVKTIVAALSVSAVMMGVSGEAQASFVSSDAASKQYGDNHVAIGKNAQVGTSTKTSDNSIAIGNNAKAQYSQSTAVGDNAQALGDRSTALGYGARVDAGTGQSIAIGSMSQAKGTQSTAIGNDTFATGNSSIAIGGDDVNAVITAAGGDYEKLTGVKLELSQWQNTDSKGEGSIAIGVQSQALGDFSTALGLTAKTEGLGSVAFGANARGTAKGATAIGTASVASNQQATAIGMNSTATGKNSTAIGSGGSTPATATKATADGAIAIGGNSTKGSQALGKNAIAIGGESSASVDNAVAIGTGASSTHGNSVALGTGSTADGKNINTAAYKPTGFTGTLGGNTAIGEVSIGKVGGERRITNMAAGSADTDGVNVSQLKALDTVVSGKITNLEKGWNIQSDSDTATAVKASDTVQFNSGTNIDVDRTGNIITVNTKQDMTLNSVSFSDTAGNKSVLTSSGLKVSNAAGSNADYGSEQLVFNKGTANAVSIGNTGINAGNQKITKVADGELSSTSKDAVNGSQLYQTNQNVQKNTGDIANLSQGWKLQSDNDTASAVKAGDTVQFNSGKNIDVSRNGNTLTIATKDDLVLNSVKLQDASGNNSISSAAGTTLTDAAGNTYITTAEGSVLTNANGDETKLTAAGTEVSDALGNNATYGANGISIGNTTGTVINIADGNVNFGGNVISGVGDGVTAGDAVNKGQLDGLGDSLSSLGLNFAGNAGNTVHKDLGQTLSIVGAASVAGDYNGKNVKTLTDAAGNLQIQIAENPEFDSVIAGDTASGNFSVIGSGGTTVTDAAGNVANYGANSSSFTDTAGNNSISSAAGTTLTDAAGNTYITTAEGSVLTNANGDETKLTAAGTEVSDALGNNASYGANGISIGNTAGTVINIADGNVNFGGNVINNVGDGVTAGDAVNKGQLDGLGDSLSSLGLNFAGNAGNTVHKDLGQTLSIVGAASVAGDYNGKNVKTLTDAAGNLQIQIAENPEFDSVIAGDTASGNFSVIGSGGTTVTDAAGNVANYGANSSSFTDTAGNNSISSAAGTTLTDAAGNTYITTAEGSVLTNANGDETKLTAAGTEVSDALGNNATYGANGISIGNTTGTVINIADGNVNFGGNVISGVGDGVTAGDAVNKGQLDGLGDSLSSLGLNFAGNAGNTVHKDLGQTLSIVGAASVAGDYNGKNVKTLTDAAGNLQIQIAENPEFDSVIAGDTASGNFSVIGSGGTTVTDAAGNVANYGANSSSFTDTAGNNSISSAAGTTLTDAAGNTYITTAEGSVLTNANGDETKLTAAGTEVSDALGNNASYGANGISIGNTAGTVINIADGNVNFGGNVINNVGDGVTAGDAVNKGQLDGLGDSLSSLGLNFAGNAGNTVHKDLGQTLSIVGAASVAGDYNGKNVKTLTDAAGNLQIQIAENPEFDSVIAGDTASGNFSVIGSGGTTVTDAAGNVANYGANSSSFTDTAGNNSISSAAGTTLTDAAGNTYITTAEGSVLTNANGDETKLTAAGTEVSDALGNNASYGANGISIGNTAGTVINIADGNVNFGGNVINNVGDGVTAGDAVNKGQLDGLGDSLSSLGLNFAGNAGNTVHKDLGQTLSIVGAASVAGDYNGKNVKTLTDAAGNLQIQIAENPEFDSVIAGDTASGNFSVIGSGGTTVTDALGNNASYGANGISINSAAGNNITIADGNVNFGGNTLSGIGAGVNPDDAVNKGQLDNLGNNLADNIFGGNAAYDGNTITWSNIGGTGANTVDSAISSLNGKVNLGWNAADTAGNTFNVAAGQTVGFVNTDGNIDIAAAGSSLTFALSKDITLNSISMQDAAGNVNYVDATGSRVADALGNNAFYGAIGSQFTDKAGNSFNSSATGSIVTNAAGDSTNVSAGNISVSTGNGGTVNIGGNGIDAGGNNITNVADGKAPGDAVNKGQLDTAVDNINNSIGAAINGGVQYDKNADGTVNKGSITLEGGANGTTITNVANGKVEAGSKDAVNGGQLHDALQQINNNQSTINNDILGVTVGPDGKPKLDLDIYDVANQTKTGDLTLVDAINTVNQEGTKYAHTNAADESEEPGLINPDNNAASAGGKNSSAFGVNAIVDETATNGLAMGYQSQVGAGATNSVSIGSQTQANGESSLALGHGSQANGKQSISIGTGNIVNGNHSGAIGDPSVINGDNSYVLGNNNHIDADNSFVVGNEVTIGKDAADMSKANGASFGGSVGIGNGSTVAAAVGTQNVTIGNTTYEFAGSAPVGTVSVGGKDEERTLTNVAAGRIDATSTDAINGSQLHATNQAVGDLYQMNNKLNNRIDGLEDESRAGVATALAVANLPQVYIPGKSGLAIATGVHKGEVGYALGYSSISEGGNWVFKASATANRMGDVGGGAGLLYMFD